MLGARHAAFIAAVFAAFIIASSTATGVSVIQSNSTAPPGEFWVEGNKMHWTDGSSEYALPHLSSGKSGAGHVWVENQAIHFKSATGGDGRCVAPEKTKHTNKAFEGDTWVEDGTLRYIDAGVVERSLPDPIDEFEDGDPLTDDYGGSTGSYSYTTQATLPESQEALMGQGTGSYDCIKAKTIMETIRDGDSVSFHFTPGGEVAAFRYNVPASGGGLGSDPYRITMDVSGDEVRIQEPGTKFSPPTTLANASITWTGTEAWYTITLTRESTGDDVVRVYDKDMNQEASLTASSTQDGYKYYHICHKSSRIALFDDIDKSCTDR